MSTFIIFVTDLAKVHVNHRLLSLYVHVFLPASQEDITFWKVLEACLLMFHIGRVGVRAFYRLSVQCAVPAPNCHRESWVPSEDTESTP